MTDPSPDPATQDVSDLTRLVGEMFYRFEADGPEAIESFCKEHPEREQEIRSMVAELARFGFLQGERPEEDVPKKLGEFELLDLLGSGGMGVVYRARQQSLGREVALKLVRPEQLYFPKALERFRREVEALARLEHRGIVHVYASGVEKGIPFFAMELLRGKSLQELLAELGPRRGADRRSRDGGRLYQTLVDAGKGGSDEVPGIYRGSWVQCSTRIALRVAEALHHAHSNGIFHRDVKPSNIMLTSDGRVQLLDFGLAHSDQASTLTRSGAQLGSLPYMSPEQVEGGKVDARTDVYGLGVTLYELLSGRRAYDQAEGSRLRAAILSGETRPPSAHVPGLPRDIETICLKAMHVDPHHRYAGVDELARDLRAFLELRPIEARRPGTLYRMRRYSQRHPARATALVAVVLVALLGPMFYAMQEAKAAERERQVSDQLRRALGDKEREFARAETNLAKAREAIDKLVAQVSDRGLSSLPGIDTLRAKTLADAVAFYDELKPASEDDPRHLWERARSRLRVSTLRARLGAMPEAEKDLVWVIAKLEQLAPLRKEQPVVTSDLASAYKAMAVIHGNTGRSKTALEFLRRAIDTYRSLCADHAEVLGYRLDLVTELSNLANRELRLGRPDETRKLLGEAESLIGQARADHFDPSADFSGSERSTVETRQAIIDLEKATLLADRARLAHVTSQLEEAGKFYERSIHAFADIDPDVLSPRLQERRLRCLGDHCGALSGVAQQRGKLDLSSTWARRSLDHRKAYADRYPERPQGTSALASARSHLGNLLCNTGHEEEGLEELRAAVDIEGRLVQRYPEQPSYARRAAISYSNLAVLLGSAEGQVWMEKALALWNGLVDAQPTVPIYRDGYGVALNLAYKIFDSPERRRSLAALAVTQFREALKAMPGSSRYHTYLASSLAKQAAALCALDRGPEAIVLLTEAVTRHGYPRDELQQPAFESLSSTPAFQRLLPSK